MDSKWVAFWVLRVLWFRHQTVYLQTIFTQVQRWLQLSDDLMADEYDSSQSAQGSRVEHQMRWSLTELRGIGFVQNTAPGRGGWSITDQGSRFLEPLRTDPDQTELNSRPTHPTTFIEMTNAEEHLRNELHDLLIGGPSGQGQLTSPTRPDGWPEGPTRSRGALRLQPRRLRSARARPPSKCAEPRPWPRLETGELVGAHALLLPDLKEPVSNAWSRSILVTESRSRIGEMVLRRRIREAVRSKLKVGDTITVPEEVRETAP